MMHSLMRFSFSSLLTKLSGVAAVVADRSLDFNYHLFTVLLLFICCIFYQMYLQCNLTLHKRTVMLLCYSHLLIHETTSAKVSVFQMLLENLQIVFVFCMCPWDPL